MPTNRADNAELKLTFGATLRDSRHRLGITQQELADRADMHRTYLADLERGMRNPALSAIARIAAALELDLPEFFARMEQMAKTMSATPAARRKQKTKRRQRSR